MSSLKDKLALLVPCGIIGAAVVSNLKDDLKSDPEGLDPTIIQQNEFGLRVDRTLYAWLVQSYNDETMWPKPPEGVSKAELLTVSALHAAGEITNFPDEMPLDVTTLDPKVIQDNAAAWRIWRTRYGWLCLSLSDKVMWPDAPDGVAPVAPVSGGGLTLDSLKSLLPVALKDAAIISMVKAAFLG